MYYFGPAAVALVTGVVISLILLQPTGLFVPRHQIRTLVSFPDRSQRNAVLRVSPPPPPVSENDQFRKTWYPWELRASKETTKVFISCAYNKGRSGHELKDVATTFVLAVWFGWTPCAQDWWTTRSVKLFAPALGLSSCRVNHRGELQDDNPFYGLQPTPVVRVVKFSNTSYDGLDVMTVLALRDRVAREITYAREGEAILVYLTKSTRVHTDQAFSWARTKPNRLPPDVFPEVRHALQVRLFKRLHEFTRKQHGARLDMSSMQPHVKNVANVQCSPGKRCTVQNEVETVVPAPLKAIVVAIHLRRGDIGAGMAAGEYTSKAFAQRLVNDLHAKLDGCDRPLEIHIYTEQSGANDLKKKPHVRGITKVWVGGTSHLYQLHDSQFTICSFDSVVGARHDRVHQCKHPGHH